MSKGDVAKLLRDVRWGAMLKLALVGVGAFLVMAGFDFTTPAQTFRRQDTAIARTSKRMDRMEDRQQTQEENTLIMLRVQCVDNRLTKRDRQLVGLDCPKLLDRRTAVTQAGTPGGTP